MKRPENGCREETSVRKAAACGKEIRENQNPFAPSVHLCLGVNASLGAYRQPMQSNFEALAASPLRATKEGREGGRMAPRFGRLLPWALLLAALLDSFDGAFERAGSF
jgi:hypothetical protein